MPSSYNRPKNANFLHFRDTIMKDMPLAKPFICAIRVPKRVAAYYTDAQWSKLILGVDKMFPQIIGNYLGF